MLTVTASVRRAAASLFQKSLSTTTTSSYHHDHPRAVTGTLGCRLVSSVPAAVPSSSSQSEQQLLQLRHQRRDLSSSFAHDEDHDDDHHQDTDRRYHDDDDDEDQHWIIHQLPPQFLRHSCSHNFDPNTLQRCDVTYNLQNGKTVPSSSSSSSSKYQIQSCQWNDDTQRYTILWADGHASEFSKQWMEDQLAHWQGTRNTAHNDKQTDDDDNSRVRPILWTGWTEESLRQKASIEFHDLIRLDSHSRNVGSSQALKLLYQYGILLVTNTPVDDHGDDGAAAVAAMGSCFSGSQTKNDTSILWHYNKRQQQLQKLQQQQQQQHQQRNNENNRETKNGEHSLLQSFSKNNYDHHTPPDHPLVHLPYGTDGPLRTLYGTVWSTHSGAQCHGTSVADSAYGHDALPLHTDFTYWRDPPGLQLFCMVQPALHNGGASVFGDGFAAAETLRQRNPQAFQILTQTIRRYRSVDPNTGWHLEAQGPIISLSQQQSQQQQQQQQQQQYQDKNRSHFQKNTFSASPAAIVASIRHNDLDRLPDLPPPPAAGMSESEMDSFYQQLESAHAAWDDILGSEEMRLVVHLKKGDTIVVANQRCFHGRCSFDVTPSSSIPDNSAARIITGCYVGKDELDSRWRMEGYNVIV